MQRVMSTQIRQGIVSVKEAIRGGDQPLSREEINMKTVRARRKSLIAGLPAWLASLVAAAIAGSAFSYLLQYVLAADPGLRADNRLGVVFYGGIWVICVAAASMIAGCCLVFGWRPRRSELGLLGLCSIAVVLAVAAIPPLSAGANMLGAFVLAVALGIL